MTRLKTLSDFTKRLSCGKFHNSMPNLKPISAVRKVASFFRMASWIGGDRDGNPNVNAQTLILALRRQCEVALRHYLTEIHLLGGELSSTLLLVACTPELTALAERSGDKNPQRGDEPYRRALIGIYARLAATLLELTGTEAARHAVTSSDPYRDADALQADLGIIEASLGRE